jgi:pyrimidine operon attenuation protein / uracil phosphoribosyltransferase
MGALEVYSPPMTKKPTIVLDERALDRTLRRMTDQILEGNAGTDALVIVGIQRRGVQLAERIVKIIEAQESVTVPQGALDITLYRDDLQTVGPRPVVGATHLPWTLDNQRVVIVDDVLYTGRTVRAALDELADFGRPARITLAVLIDRGGRELPIHADVVGRRVEVLPSQRVDVFVEELDGRNEVVIASRTDES